MTLVHRLVAAFGAVILMSAAPALARENHAALDQRGDGLSGAIVQNGDRNAAGLVQRGQDLSGKIIQSGNDNSGCLMQSGRSLEGTLAQYGGATGAYLQTRGGVMAVPQAVCMNARWGRVLQPTRQMYGRQ
jgi:hypothetical protein